MHGQDITKVPRPEKAPTAAAAIKGYRGGPVKTRLLTKSVTSANKESPLHQRGVELD